MRPLTVFSFLSTFPLNDRWWSWPISIVPAAAVASTRFVPLSATKKNTPVDLWKTRTEKEPDEAQAARNHSKLSTYSKTWSTQNTISAKHNQCKTPSAQNKIMQNTFNTKHNQCNVVWLRSGWSLWKMAIRTVEDEALLCNAGSSAVDFHVLCRNYTVLQV